MKKQKTTETNHQADEPEPATPSPALKWTFAKTLSKTPHEYVMRNAENAAAFDELGRCWKKFGTYHVWPVNGRRYKYWFARDGFRYWLIGWPGTRTPGANRTRIDDAEGWFAEQIKQSAGVEQADHYPQTKKTADKPARTDRMS